MTSEISIPANGAIVQVSVGTYKYVLVREAANPFFVSYDFGLTWIKRSKNDRDETSGKTERVYCKAYAGVAVDVTIETSTSPISAQDTVVTGAVASYISNDIANCVAVIPLQFAKVGNVANPVPLANAALYFRWALVIAQRDLAGAANTNNIKLGVGAAANQQPIVLAPGDQYVLPIPTGAKADFQNWHLAIADVGDGVVVIYV